MQDPVVIMNFTHIYEDETFYSSEQKSSTPRSCEASSTPLSGPAPVSFAASSNLATARSASSKPYILDFTTLSGTTGFCDDAAADEIRRRIADFPARGLHFLDNGNFHYLTRFWCEKISEDFALVVYDHHVDLRKPVFPGLMSCGSWIRDVLLRNRHCRAVLIIGPERAQTDIIERELQSLVAEDQPPRSSAPARLYCFTEDDILDGRVARELPHLLDALHLPVYISIDKDVLSRKVLRTNWDQGIMTEAEFRHELDRFTMDPKIHILGVDICGEPAYNACRRLLDDTRDLRRSDGVNRRLLEHYLSRAH